MGGAGASSALPAPTEEEDRVFAGRIDPSGSLRSYTSITSRCTVAPSSSVTRRVLSEIMYVIYDKGVMISHCKQRKSEQLKIDVFNHK